MALSLRGAVEIVKENAAVKPNMDVAHFVSAQEFRVWLAKNHTKEKELVVGLCKKASGKPSITYAEALDEALCFGWIDGVRRSINAESYSIRFTPRKTKSIWSLVNMRHVKRLKSAGKMTSAGLKAFAAREAHRTGIYAFEQKRPGLSAKHRKALRANAKAWEFLNAQAPWYQRTAGYWVSSAKQEETRQRRLAILINDSASGKRLARLTPKRALESRE